MHIIRLKQFTILLNIFFLTSMLVACSDTKTYTTNKEIQMKLIPYGTNEFNEFLNQPHKVSLEESWNLYHKYATQQLEYYDRHNIPIKERKTGYMALLFFIVDNHYVYTTSYPLMKTDKINYGQLINGVWVNADTGEVNYIDNNTQFNSDHPFMHWGIGKDIFPADIIEKMKKKRANTLK